MGGGCRAFKNICVLFGLVLRRREVDGQITSSFLQREIGGRYSTRIWPVIRYGSSPALPCCNPENGQALPSASIKTFRYEVERRWISWRTQSSASFINLPLYSTSCIPRPTSEIHDQTHSPYPSCSELSDTRPLWCNLRTWDGVSHKVKNIYIYK